MVRALVRSRVLFAAIALFLVSMVSAGAGSNTWTPANLVGGLVNDLTVDPTRPSTIYAATIYGGVFKSRNGGKTWVRSSNGITELTLFTVGIDPANPDTLYTSSYGGLFKSTNGGTSWVGMAPQVISVRKFAFDTQTSSIYAATGSDGVMRSTDGGATWTALFSPTGLNTRSVYDLAIDRADPSHIVVGAYEGLFVSKDAGASWTLVTKPFAGSNGAALVFSVVIDPFNGSIVYASGATTAAKSTDGGLTFKAMAVSQDGTGYGRLFADPAVKNRIFNASSGPAKLSVSSNGGKTWKDVTDGLPTGPGSEIRAVVSDPSAGGKRLLAATGEGAFASANAGGSWTASNGGLRNVLAFSVAVDPSNANLVYVGTRGHLMKSVNGGRTFKRADAGLVGPFTDQPIDIRTLAIDPSNPKVLYAGGNLVNTVFKTVDGGDSWTRLTSFKATGIPLSIWIDPKAPEIVVIGTVYSGVWISVNGGKTFKARNRGLMTGTGGIVLPGPKSLTLFSSSELASASPIELVRRVIASALAADFNPGHVAPYSKALAASGLKWKPACDGRLTAFVTSVTGVKFTTEGLRAMLLGIGSASYVVDAMLGPCSGGDDGGAAAVDADGEVSQPWTDAPADLSGCTPYYGMLVDPGAKARIYLPGQCGVYLVDAKAATVSSFNKGLPGGLVARSVAATKKGRDLYVATLGGGLYRYTNTSR